MAFTFEVCIPEYISLLPDTFMETCFYNCNYCYQIYGDNQTSSRDCFKMFNPVDLPTFKVLSFSIVTWLFTPQKRRKLTNLHAAITQTLLNDWSAAFFTIFKMGPFHLDQNSTKAAEKWVSIDEYLDGYLVERKNRYGKNMEVIDVGMQEIKTYFRLFLLSSVLLMFMFCSRIAKSKYGRNSIPVVMQWNYWRGKSLSPSLLTLVS